MALREQSRSRSVKGRHRAVGPAASVELPEQRTSHRWTSAVAEERAARLARLSARWIPAPRRSPETPLLPSPRRSPELEAGAWVSAPPAPTTARAEAARLAASGLAGARLATAVLGRATGERAEPGVTEAPADPWGRRPLPVRYRPLPRRRRRMAAVWILLALVLVAAVGAIPSALRDPAVRATATEDIGGGGGGGGRVAPAPAEFTDQLPDGRAQTAVDAALSQVGVPYQWGGDGPGAGDQGFDCSGLTVFAYAAAGIGLPRTAHTQYVAGPHVPAGAALQPGDLVFYGSSSAVHHVGLYLGDGRMVNAPTYDQPVQVSYYRWRGDDYLGATRPAATGERRTGLLEYLTEPLHPGPRTFDAPRAPMPLSRVEPSVALPPEGVTAAAAISAVEGVASPSGVPAAPTGWRPAPAAWVLPAAGVHQAAAGVDQAPGVDSGVDSGAASAGVPAAPAPSQASPSGDTAPQAVALSAATVPGARTGVDPVATAPSAAADPVATAPSEAADPVGTAPDAATGPSDPADEVIGTLVLPAGPVPLHAARLDDAGVPVPPAPGTAALLDEGGAQLLLLPAVDAIPLDHGLTVLVEGADPWERTVVEPQSLTAAELGELVRALPDGEQQIAAPAPDGTWTLAELE